MTYLVTDRIEATRGSQQLPSWIWKQVPVFVRRSPAIVLSLVLSSAALALTPPALASDGGAAKDDPVADSTACSDTSRVRIRATVQDDGSIEAVGVVFSDDTDFWDWKFKHNGDFSAMGQVKANENAERSFRIVRTMVDLSGPDDIFFRAENDSTGEVCKLEITA
jgi:hypothetical protein